MRLALSADVDVCLLLENKRSEAIWLKKQISEEKKTKKRNFLEPSINHSPEKKSCVCLKWD